jgi:hypothetical protein
MAHVVEAAKSGRARCRTCGEGILKGDFRFGEEVPNAFSESGGTTFHWHHLRCAAKKKPYQLAEALETFPEAIPEREEIDRLIAENAPKQKPTSFPYAERASTGRARCGECRKMIDKGELRVALQREPDGPQLLIMPATPRYYHAACARAALEGEPEAIVARIQKNSRGLPQADADELLAALRSAPPPLVPATAPRPTPEAEAGPEDDEKAGSDGEAGEPPVPF